MQFGPTYPSKTAVMRRLTKLGTGVGLRFGANVLSPKPRQAVREGIADTCKTFAEFKTTQIDRKAYNNDTLEEATHAADGRLVRCKADKS
jgi:hypothetical protein